MQFYGNLPQFMNYEILGRHLISTFCISGHVVLCQASLQQGIAGDETCEEEVNHCATQAAAGQY